MKRLLSLDILRGITVCGMILVNNAGGPVSYAPLRHSVWNGLTPCDLVFPFFSCSTTPRFFCNRYDRHFIVFIYKICTQKISILIKRDG